MHQSKTRHARSERPGGAKVAGFACGAAAIATAGTGAFAANAAKAVGSVMPDADGVRPNGAKIAGFACAGFACSAGAIATVGTSAFAANAAKAAGPDNSGMAVKPS